VTSCLCLLLTFQRCWNVRLETDTDTGTCSLAHAHWH
jgi:hypothetical protein